MTAHPDQTSVELPCHVCGYDLRVHPHDGKCPECGASVEESRRVAAIPRRPAWRDSDPRWRRRMLAGAWALVLLPLMDVLRMSEWAARVQVPTLLEFRNGVRMLDDTLVYSPFVYQPLVFCIGVVLLFSKERGRRRGRLDWTRRWGVVCSYVVLLISATTVFFIAALVLAGIGALFHSMPPQFQPTATQLIVDVGSGYLLYGAHPMEAASLVLVAFSSIVVLLACVALYDALRSSGPKRFAVVLVAPLALFSLMHLAQLVRYWLGSSSPTSEDVLQYGVYFRPALLVSNIIDGARGMIGPGPAPSALAVETVKWCVVLAIAVWLSIAQFAAWRRRRRD